MAPCVVDPSVAVPPEVATWELGAGLISHLDELGTMSVAPLQVPIKSLALAASIVTAPPDGSLPVPRLLLVGAPGSKGPVPL